MDYPRNNTQVAFIKVGVHMCTTFLTDGNVWVVDAHIRENPI